MKYNQTIKLSQEDNSNQFQNADNIPLKYIVVREEGNYYDSYSTYNDFEETVNRKLENGWKLCGGVTIGNVGDDHFCICQAMVKEER